MHRFEDDGKGKGKERNSLKSIRKSLIENVSVAGWKEAIDEDIRWIRWSYRLVLLVFSVCCVYLCVQTWRQFFSSGYTDDITDFSELASLAFSNVTICAQISLNRSFIRETLVIPDGFFEKYHLLTKGDIDQFFDQLTIYLSFVVKGVTFTALQLVSFEKIMRANSELFGNYPDFYDKAAFPCDSILRKCSFGGREFDCCRNAVRALSDDGICYLLPLNFDYDNAIPRLGTQRQSIAGPRGGLSVETLVNTSFSPWAESDASNGFTLLINPISFGMVQTPSIAPHGAETFIRITPVLHRSEDYCAQPGKLVIDNKDDDLQLDYDPEGLACGLQKAAQLSKKFTNCIPMIGGVYLRNGTIACDPSLIYAMGQIIKTDILQALRMMETSNTGMSTEKLEKYRNEVEQALQTTTSMHSACPVHCEYWTYSTTSSFYDLEKVGESNHTMRSTIRIYYGDLSYRKYAQVPEYPAYLAFCDFSNLVALYWGMSIVSFFHVFYYVIQYAFFLAMMKRKKAKIAVEPGGAA